MRRKALEPSKDLNNIRRLLKKITVEAVLNTDMVDYLGDEKHAKWGC